jgi:proline dehydrogenase
MSRLITQLSPKEEEMFRNMIRRMNTIVKVVEDCRWVFVGGNV